MIIIIGKKGFTDPFEKEKTGEQLPGFTTE
jgi:hypothetical protein